MENQEKHIIEIQGIKFEVDLRNAKIIDNYKIGDAVKVLCKKYSTYESYPGIIIGFDNFKHKPTIIVAYLETDYSTAKIKTIYFNSATEEVEICPMSETGLAIDKQTAVDYFDREILKKEEELRDLKQQKQYFLNRFGMYFKDFNKGD